MCPVLEPSREDGDWVLQTGLSGVCHRSSLTVIANVTKRGGNPMQVLFTECTGRTGKKSGDVNIFN